MSELRFSVFGSSPLADARKAAARAHEDAVLVDRHAADFSASEPDNWPTLFDPARIDVALLALPANVQTRAIIAALRAGLHVLAEPAGVWTVEDIINVREAERQSRRTLKFAAELAWHDSVHEALTLCRSGQFGQLLSARAVYGHAGRPDSAAENAGILHTHGLEMIDLLHLFCGPFETVKATASAPPGREDNLFAILTNGSGAIAQLHVSATSWRQTFRLELGFSEGYVWLDGHLPGHAGYGPEMLIHARLTRGETGAPLPNPDETIREFTAPHAASRDIEDFLHAAASGRPPRYGNSHQAFDTVNIAQRICAATETWA